MDQWLNKLERKFGKYAIPDLIRYVMVLYCAGSILEMAYDMGMLRVNIYYQWLCLDMEKVLQGQVWRIFTFLIEPYGFSLTSGAGFVLSVLFFIIEVSLFMLFGRSLEQAWGTFRFNMYFFSGYFLNLIAALILFLCPLHVTVYDSGFHYLYMAMFMAFAMLNPDFTFLLYFIIPIKAKWLALLDGLYLAYSVLSNLFMGMRFLFAGGAYQQYSGIYISMAMAALIALGNFLVFFLSTRNYRRMSPKNVKRRREFSKKMQTTKQRTARHQCSICGRTSEDSPQLDFRYCSKCEGNYEYCSDHLFTHQHVKKFM